MQEFDKKLSDKIRQELGSYEPEFAPAHWNSMQAKLIATRRLFWLKTLAISLGAVALISFGIWYCMDDTQRPLVSQNKEKEAGSILIDTAFTEVMPDSIVNNSDETTLKAANASSLPSNEIQKTQSTVKEQPAFVSKNASITEEKTQRLNGDPIKNSASNTHGSEKTSEQFGKDVKENSEEENLVKTQTDTSITAEKNNQKENTSSSENELEEEKINDSFNQQEEGNQQNELIILLEKLPSDSLDYFIWEDSIPSPTLFEIPTDSVLLPQTEPAVKYELGFLNGVALLRANASNAIGFNSQFELNRYLQKRVFAQLSVAYQIYRLKTNTSVYTPEPLPTFDDTLSFAPPANAENAFREYRYDIQPFAYTLPSINITTSIGYHFYQSKKLNLFVALGVSNYLWGKVTVEPYQETGSSNDFLYIASSIDGSNTVENYPITYQSISRIDLLNSVNTKLGFQYQINKKWSVQTDVWNDRSLIGHSPVDFKMNRYGIRTGVILKLK